MFSLCVPCSAPAQAKRIKVEVDREYQTIDHFAASDCWSMQKIGAWPDAQKEKVADLLFSQTKGIGLSAWRFNIGGGINQTTIQHPWRSVETFEIAPGVYDWTHQLEERWFLQAAKERGVGEFIAFVNSPPGRMTRNGKTNCTDGNGSTNLKEGYETQYARYLVDILKHFRDEQGIRFGHISPVNEPQWEWNNGCNQEGNRAGNEDIRKIVNALYDELHKQAVDTEISIVESGDLRSWYEVRSDISNKYGKTYGNYLSELIDDETINTQIGSHFGGHSYWSDRLSNQLVQDRASLSNQMKPYLDAGWKYWVTEYTVMDGPEGAGGHGRDLTMKTALDVCRIIHYDLTLLGASAWSWWTAVSPEDYKDGLLYTNYKDNPASLSVIESKLLWAYGNFSRFIRPGSVRVRLMGAADKSGLLGSAYVNAENDKLILVFINMSYETQTINLDISGLESSCQIDDLIPYITSDTAGDDLKPYPATSLEDNISIPRRAVVTLIGDIVDTTEIKKGLGTHPGQFKLYQNYPNPFNNQTLLSYYLPDTEDVQVKIFSQIGTQVKMIHTGKQDAGLHVTPWDGTDNLNRSVGSGVYICSLQAGVMKEIKKMVLIQ